ncbi:MAG: hypothetical protein LBD13_03575, partial [Spirochaetaceae bacterium]|nr:hypothetical protein [Spirochaetaceae bacterium]
GKQTYFARKKTYFARKQTYFARKKTGFPAALGWYIKNYRRFRASLGTIWGNQFPQTPAKGFLRCARALSNSAEAHLQAIPAPETRPAVA